MHRCIGYGRVGRSLVAGGGRGGEPCSAGIDAVGGAGRVCSGGLGRVAAARARVAADDGCGVSRLGIGLSPRRTVGKSARSTSLRVTASPSLRNFHPARKLSGDPDFGRAESPSCAMKLAYELGTCSSAYLRRRIGHPPDLATAPGVLFGYGLRRRHHDTAGEA